MLYKDLKSQISEADTVLPAAENTTVTEQPPITKKRIPQSAVKAKKEATDGIGSETYQLSNEIAKNLDSVLRRYYNISRVSTSKNTITLTSDLNTLKDNQITDRRSHTIVSSDIMLNTIQQIIAAGLGKKMDAYNLIGPQEIAP